MTTDIGTILPARPANFTRRSRSLVSRFAQEGRFLLIPLYWLLRLSDFAREGMEHSGSYRFADHMYRGEPSGRGPIGRLLDRILLGLPATRSMRQRCFEARDTMRREFEAYLASGQSEPFRILTIPCGLPRDVRDFVTKHILAGQPWASVELWHDAAVYRPSCSPAKAESTHSHPSIIAPPSGTWVNDVHSRLNVTRVCDIAIPNTIEELTAEVCAARDSGESVCVSGSRHAMGTQQFASGKTLIDLRQLNRVLSFDSDRGQIEVEAGIQWPKLVEACLSAQLGNEHPFGIAQKQTGADNLTLGGSLAANVHGRGLSMKPLISDVESFELLDARGTLVRCSRTENTGLFELAIGGYGLFGIVTRVTLRLVPRQPVQRLVELTRTDQLMEGFAERIREGCLYGDFQFNIDERSSDFLQKGVLSCYRPLPGGVPEPSHKALCISDWNRLLRLACTNRSEGFRLYTAHYLSTHEQVYWSDTHQLGPYVFEAEHLETIVPEIEPSNVMITELYIPRDLLHDFLREASRALRRSLVPVIYGTVRLIERDTESFLAWAKQPYACVVFNLLIRRTAASFERARETFRSLIDLAIARGGSYYLTYHRFAAKQQVETAYPRFREFLRRKKLYDPADVFVSDWYRHHQRLLSGS